MSARARYIGSRNARKIAVQAIVLLGLLPGLAGCGIIGLPFGPDRSSLSMETTAAVPARAEAPAVDPSDWETVRREIAALPTKEAHTIPWTNPDTGSSGTLTVAAVTDARLLTGCRVFSTTLSDVRGVRIYRGQACRQINGRWQIKSIAPDDTHLS